MHYRIELLIKIGVFVGVFYVIFNANSANCQQWYFTQVDTNSFITGGGVLAIDNLDQPHIFYFDQDSHTLKHANLINDNWVIESYDYYFKPCNVATDTEGNFHLCATGLYDIRYMKIASDSTVFTIIADTTNPRFTDAEIAVYSANNRND